MRARVLRAVACVALGSSTGSALAQPAPFLTSLGVPAGATSSRGVRVSPSGDYVFGACGLNEPCFVWSRTAGFRFDLPLPPGSAYLEPALINESLPVIGANGPIGGIHLFTGSAFVPIGSTIPPYQNLSLVEASEDGLIVGFNGTSPRALEASIVIEAGVIYDLGAILEVQHGVPFVTDRLTDVAADRPTSVGYAVDSQGGALAYLYDHCSQVMWPIASPGLDVYPLAVSADGLNVTGYASGPTFGPTAFHWTRRGLPAVGGPAPGTFTLIGTLPGDPLSLGLGIDGHGRAVVGLSLGGTTSDRAFVWRAITSGATPGLHLLQPNLPPSPFASLDAAVDMSTQGVVTGVGTIGQTPTAFAGRLSLAGCRADFAWSWGIVDVGDLLAFLAAYNAGLLEADVDGDCMITPNDALVMQAWYVAGCQ